MTRPADRPVSWSAAGIRRDGWRWRGHHPGTTVAFLALAVAGARGLAAQRVTYTGSVQVANGDYTFGERTTSLYFASGLSLDASRLHLTVSVPVVAQSAGWVQSVGGGVVPSGGMHSEESSASGHGRNGMMQTAQSNAQHSVWGIGDPIARADLDVVRSAAGAPVLRAGIAAKMPVAALGDGYGTGQWDYGAGLSAAATVGDGFLFADATYWALGDPATVDLHNIVSYGLGAGRPLKGGRFAFLASVLGTTPVAAGVPAAVQASGSVSYRTDSGRSVLFTALAGLSPSAPDVAFGLGWRVPIR